MDLRPNAALNNLDFPPFQADLLRNLVDLHPKLQLLPLVLLQKRRRYTTDTQNLNINLPLTQTREGRGRPPKSKEIIDSSMDSGDEPTPGIITETVGSYTDEAGNRVGKMV